MCGIVGVVGTGSVNQLLYDALTVQQHRGQDAAGMVTLDGDRLYLRKDNGLVRDVFHAHHMVNLRGSLGIGHIRYPTAGCASSAEAQPFYVNSPYGVTLAHNGNLINTEALQRELWAEDLRHINTNSDSEVLLNVFAQELMRQGRHQVTEDVIFEAVAGVHGRCRGGYAAVAVVIGYAASLGLWVVAPKPVQFYYHYFLPHMFLMAGLALALAELWRAGWRWPAWAVCGASMALFAWFYPILSGAPLAGEQSFLDYAWLASWR